MSKEMRRAPSLIGLILRGVVAFVLVIYAIQFCNGLVADFKMEYEQTLKSIQIDRCELYYQGQEFGTLNRRLLSDHLYDPDFDVYWEAVEGVDALADYYQWQTAEASGVEGAEQKAAHYLQVLQENADNPQFPRNVHLLRRLLEEAQELSAGQ